MLTLYGVGTYHLDTVAQFNGFEQVNLKNLSGSFAPTEIYLRDGADISVSIGNPGEYVYQAIVHLGADADTTVSAAANMRKTPLTSYLVDRLTSPRAMDTAATRPLFSRPVMPRFTTWEWATLISISQAVQPTVYATTSTDYWNGIFNYYNLSSGTYDLHGSAYGYDNFNLTDPSQLQTGTSIDGGTGPAADTVKFGAISPTT